MITNKFYIFIFIGILSLSSCDKGFEEMNKDPNNPTSIPAELMLPGITTSAMNNMYSLFVNGDMGATWSQQISKVQYNDEERFYPRNSTIDGFWSSMYVNVISDADEMYKLAELEGNNDLMGIALVLKAYGFSVLTDCYGMIPYSEALMAAEGNTTPAYDLQKDVYTGIVSMLTKADALLGTGTGVGSTYDVIYHGNISKWNKFANSLKFRTLMRESGKVDVSGDLQALYNSGNMFASNDDEAKLIYEEASPNANPIFESIVDGGRNEWKACSTLVNLMDSKADPRLSVFFGLNEDDVIRAKDPGYADVPNDDYNYANVSPVGDFYLRPEAPGFFMSYPELEFLIAEAATKSYITADAAAHYANGISASFDANNKTGGAADYISSNPVSLQNIAEEKYVSLFWQGIESWTETRRTGFPILQEVHDKNPNVTTAKRYFYNADEASINGESYNAAVSSQGPDLLDTPVWWMP